MALLNYDAYEKAVYEWLFSKYEADHSFCFSTRLRASKGSEHKYFIGTRKSAYFGTTFWWIPVSFPGSSSDLINLIFRFNNGAYQCYMQFGQTRAPHDEQNREALLFIKNFKEVFNKEGINFWQNDPGNKMEYYNTILADGFTDITPFLTEIDKNLNRIIQLVDEYLKDFKSSSTIEANRINEELFVSKFQKSLNIRLRKLTDTPIIEPSSSPTYIETSYEPHVFAFPPNQILYGPPGTGKTYHTINAALEILGEELNGGTRDEIKELFEQYVDEKRIVFTTFHQSISYEDFIEGIKPLKPDNSGNVKYDVVDGIFKELTTVAKSNYENSQIVNSEKLSFEEAFDKLQQEWEVNADMKFAVKTPGYEYTIIGFTNTSIQFRKASGGTSHTLSINTLREIYYGKFYSFKQGVGIYYPGILDKLNSYDRGVETVALQNYVLIIDEINRGNVSQIFGELITLLEENKREGMPEALSVTLPYSKDKFSVPLNLYIIGTMNTADRSVEALDTALRRRFSFKEMMPDYKLLRGDDYRYNQLVEFHEEYDAIEWPDWEKNYFDLATNFYESLGLEITVNSKEEHELYDIIQSNGFKKENLMLQLSKFTFKDMFDLAKLLEVINKRITILYDREHQIGHSYFLKIKNRINPFPELRHCFQNEIIPLLQEYFFGDYEKIGLVLGEGFVIKTASTGNVFAKFNGSNPSDFVRPVYEINQAPLANDEVFKSALDKLIGYTINVEAIVQGV